MRPQNRFENFFSRLNIFHKFAILAVILALIEGASLLYFAVGLKRSLSEYIAVSWLVAEKKADKQSKVEFPSVFLGNLNADSKLWHKVFLLDPLRGWKNAPAISYTNYGTDYYASNSQGFMSIGEHEFYYQKKKPVDTYRIIVIGGSTVYGQGVRLPKDNLPAKLKQQLLKLQIQKDKKIEVINAGVGGYSSGQELLYLITDLYAYSPDLVIAYNGWNDQHYVPGLLHTYGNEFGALKTREHYKMETIVADYFENRRDVTSEFARLMLSRLRRVATVDLVLEWAGRFAVPSANRNYVKANIRDEEIQALFASLTKDPESSEVVASAELYIRNLELMIAAAKAHKFKLAIFLQPLMDVDGKVPSNEEQKIHANVPSSYFAVRKVFYEKARQGIRQLGEEHNGADIHVTDLSQKVFLGKSEHIYVDIGHVNAQGNDLIAVAMAADLERYR
ncbi:MAG TPA: SGNH/GDSL hydrolase family protein [Burkholderiales bacterium]|jgi:lysophospholipase L1-like esterase|nr:SGNH/GDSL hydrolase family protein [Burkholderiales bacterium]